ncbi:MAG: NAD(P)-dependent oxidoreductase [Thermoleophilia bacterium]
MSAFLMGLDVGGRSVRCSLVNVETGGVVTVARPWGATPATGTGFFSFTLDTDRCVQLAGEVSREVLHKAGAAPHHVIGVAVTGMRFSLVVTDPAGEVLLALPNRDARAAGEGILLADDHGPLFSRRAGHWPSPIFMAARLRWLTENAPDILARAVCAYSLSDWLASQLTGVNATDPSQAGETLLFDLANADWAWDLVDMLGLPRRLFPPVYAGGTSLGPLTSGAADRLGLAPGTPVAVGGADTQCGLLGVGVTTPGQMGIIAGSTAPLQLVTSCPHVDEQARVWAGNHVVPGAWILESNAGAMGETLDWFAGVLYPDSPVPVVRFLADAARSAPGSGGVVSSLGAELMDARSLSLPVGTLSLTHLDAGGDGRGLGEARANLTRAVLEGMAFAVKANATQLASAAGEAGTQMAMAGGMTRSGLWTQMVCDVLGLPVTVSDVADTSGVGAAICAGVAAGLYGDVTEGAQALVRVHALTPAADSTRTYADLYTRWDDLRRVRAPADALAGEIALRAMMDRPAEQPAVAAPVPSLRTLVTAELDERSLAELRRLGNVTYACCREALRLLTGDELAEELQGCQVFVTEVDIVDVEALGRLPDLRVIAACRGHAVNVDLAACTALGIPVLYAPGRNAEAVADLTLAFMLMLCRRVAEANVFLRAPGGEAGDMGRMGQAHSVFQGRELGSATVGLVGLGAVGAAVAKRLRPFGARVVVYDPFVAADTVQRLDAAPVTLDELLITSDIVSLHAPVTDATRGMLGPGEFARMKRGALLVNTARAALVEEEALLDALRSGHLGGAGLDVFSVEPPAADHALLRLPNVIATPHLGGNTVDVAAHQGRLVVEDLRRMASGLAPRHVLNLETLEHFSWEARRPLDAASLATLGASPAAVTDLQSGGVTVPRSTVSPDPGGPQAPPSSPRDRMEQILQLFVDAAADDRALREFAEKRSVTCQYSVNDLGLDFHVCFVGGRVVSGLGVPEEPPEVKLKAKGEVLDAILTGRLNGNKAAMTGRLSFSGDVRLAMGMQKIQKDMVRLYTAARTEAGGLDFTGAGGASAEVSAPAPAAAALQSAATTVSASVPVPAGSAAAPGPSALGEPVASAGSPAASVEHSLRDEVARVTEELYAAQLITATGGNVSARIPGTDEAWISPSRLFKGDLSPEMIVRIDLDGNALDPDSLAPSSERLVHCEIYKARPDVEAVVHAHTAYATILGMTDLPFLPVTTEAAFLADLPRVPFLMPGSRELATAVRRALGPGAAVLLLNHGLVVAASSLRQAANTAEVIERASQLIWGCHAVGKKPPALPKDVLATLREIGRMMA